MIAHPSGRKLLYDLGCRKDWTNLPSALGIKTLQENGILQTLEVEKNVSEILSEGGMKLDEIEGVIWSHWHFDHTGDPSTFPPSTKLIGERDSSPLSFLAIPRIPRATYFRVTLQGEKSWSWISANPTQI